MSQHSLSQCRAILTTLADRDFHSGEELASQLGGTRASVWKYIERLRTLGIEVQSARGRGYRLSHPVEFLDPEAMNRVAAKAGLPPISIHVLQSVDSTSTWLERSSSHDLSSGTFCFAEMQTSGHGRKGRQWVSPFARNLCFSVLWEFVGGPEKLLGLSLAVGAMIVDALEGCGYPELGLKWPNDVVWEGRKLGGILIGFEGESSDRLRAVIGVGLNVLMPQMFMTDVEEKWVDLCQIGGGETSRNTLAGVLAAKLTTGLQHFDQVGWEGFRARWESLDCCKGQPVRVIMATDVQEGRALGVDRTGNLIVETPRGVRTYSSGDVSLRPIP